MLILKGFPGCLSALLFCLLPSMPLFYTAPFISSVHSKVPKSAKESYFFKSMESFLYKSPFFSCKAKLSIGNGSYNANCDCINNR